MKENNGNQKMQEMNTKKKVQNMWEGYFSTGLQMNWSSTCFQYHIKAGKT